MQITRAKKILKHQENQHNSKCKLSFTQCL